MFPAKTKTLFVVGGLAVLLAQWCWAGGVGSTAAQFLKIAPGARAVAMGGAFSAVADDVYAVYWNPAGLAGQEHRQGAASYAQHFQGISVGFFGYSQPAFRGVLGVGVDYLTVSNIERRTADTDLADDTFGANDMAVSVSYGTGRLLGEAVSVGASLKVIRQTIDTQSAQAFALDVGTLYRTPVKKLTASLGVYNLGSGVKFVDESDPLPLDIRLGAAYRMLDDALLLAVDIDDYVNEGRIYEQVGVEYVFRKALSVRAGYKLGLDASSLGGLAGFSAGLGINVWNIQLDYAFVPYGELSDTHRISIATRL